MFDAGAVVIAAGVGSFQPRRLRVESAEQFEGSQIHYRVKTASDFHGRKLVIFGGGDSALDWALDLAPKAASIALVHRRPEFRGAPASAARLRELVAAGRVRFVEGLAHSLHSEAGQLKGVHVKDARRHLHLLDAEHLLVFFGLAPKLGPIAEWGLELDKRAIKVDTEKFQTNIPGVFAIGDINTYPGQEEADPVGLPRGGAGGICDPAPSLSGQEAVPAVHDHQPGDAKAPGSGGRLMDAPAAPRAGAVCSSSSAWRTTCSAARAATSAAPQVFGGQVLGQALRRRTRPSSRSASCIRCTPTSSSAGTSMRRSSTSSIAAAMVTASPAAA